MSMRAEKPVPVAPVPAATHPTFFFAFELRGVLDVHGNPATTPKSQGAIEVLPSTESVTVIDAIFFASGTIHSTLNCDKRKCCFTGLSSHVVG